MGYMIGRGEQTFYVDDDGVIWDSPEKKQRYTGEMSDSAIPVIMADSIKKEILPVNDSIVIKKQRGRPRKER